MNVYSQIAQFLDAKGYKIIDPEEENKSNVKDRVVEYNALPHQGKLLTSPKKFVFLGGGVGSGKTDVGGIWVLNKCKQTPDGVVGLICANSYPQLLDSTMWKVYENYKKLGIDVRPKQLPKVHRPFNIYIHNGERYVEVRCRSLDAYNYLSGQELGWAWADEVFMTKKEAIDVVIARLRDKRILSYTPIQLLLTTTLDEPTSWMYDLFVDKYDPKMMDVIYAPTHANTHLEDNYIPGLRLMYSKRMYNRMVECKWVTLESGQIYYNFNRAIHIDPIADFDPNLPIYWTHDFNIGVNKPMSSCLAQVKKGRSLKDGKLRPELHFFDEIIVDSADTNQAVQEFIAREWVEDEDDYANRVIIDGDASGRAKDTRSKTTDYNIIRDAGFVYQQVRLSNPPIRQRHNSVNALLMNADDDVRCYIHPRCKKLAKGFETVRLKTGAQYLEEETYEQHVTTAAGYLIDHLFPTSGVGVVTVEVHGT